MRLRPACALALFLATAARGEVPTPSPPPPPPSVDDLPIEGAPLPSHAGWGLEVAADFEGTAVNGCCIFVDFGNGMLVRGGLASSAWQFGAAARVFGVLTSPVRPIPVGADFFGTAEYRLRFGRFALSPSAGLGGEIFSGSGSTAIGVLLEPALSFSVRLNASWSVHLRLAESWTPTNQPIGGPLSYTRLSLGVEWWSPL